MAGSSLLLTFVLSVYSKKKRQLCLTEWSPALWALWLVSELLQNDILLGTTSICAATMFTPLLLHPSASGVGVVLTRNAVSYKENDFPHPGP